MWCDAMEVKGKRVLVVGIGGGADIISAYGFGSRHQAHPLLEASVIEETA